MIGFKRVLEKVNNGCISFNKILDMRYNIIFLRFISYSVFICLSFNIQVIKFTGGGGQSIKWGLFLLTTKFHSFFSSDE